MDRVKGEEALIAGGIERDRPFGNGQAVFAAEGAKVVIAARGR